MKQFVKISSVLLANLSAGGLFLNNYFLDKKQRQNKNEEQILQTRNDTSKKAFETFGLDNFGLNTTLHIKQADDSHFHFYTDINFRVGFIGADKYSNSFIGTDYNNFNFPFEDCNETLRNEIMDSCNSQLNTLDTIIIKGDTLNKCFDDTAYIKNK